MRALTTEQTLLVQGGHAHIVTDTIIGAFTGTFAGIVTGLLVGGSGGSRGDFLYFTGAELAAGLGFLGFFAGSGVGFAVGFYEDISAE